MKCTIESAEFALVVGALADKPEQSDRLAKILEAVLPSIYKHHIFRWVTDQPSIGLGHDDQPAIASIHDSSCPGYGGPEVVQSSWLGLARVHTEPTREQRAVPGLADEGGRDVARRTQASGHRLERCPEPLPVCLKTWPPTSETTRRTRSSWCPSDSRMPPGSVSQRPVLPSISEKTNVTTPLGRLMRRTILDGLHAEQITGSQVMNRLSLSNAELHI